MTDYLDSMDAIDQDQCAYWRAHEPHNLRDVWKTLSSTGLAPVPIETLFDSADYVTHERPSFVWAHWTDVHRKIRRSGAHMEWGGANYYAWLDNGQHILGMWREHEVYNVVDKEA